MTEAEWLTSEEFGRLRRTIFTDPTPRPTPGLISRVRRFLSRDGRPAPLPNPTPRQSLLVVAALIECHGCDDSGPVWAPGEGREVARMIERSADGVLTTADASELRRHDGVTVAGGASVLMTFCEPEAARALLRIPSVPDLRITFLLRLLPERSRAGCDVLRDIFGNPFRPVAFSPDWRTSTALILARQMYDARAFSAMPILADALQDAGCDSAEVLDHCRGPGPHVRGCWVIDLVLSKE